MSLGTEVQLGPGDVVLDGVAAPSKRGTAPPVFGLCLLWPRSPISATAELLFSFIWSRQTGMTVLGLVMQQNRLVAGLPRTTVLRELRCPITDALTHALSLA